MPVTEPTPPVLDQPGTRNARLIMLRPLTGRFTTCLVSRVSDSVLESVSNSGEAASVTVTVCVVPPTLRITLMVVTRAV